ncbi:MAG: DsrH/TusB family sulfur metabolism protein [Pseudomonadota bacterium]
MATLHCIDSPPQERLNSIISHLATSDIVLILDQDPTAFAPYSGLIEHCHSAGVEAYFLANGISTSTAKDSSLASVDYAGWVTLSERCDKQVHW